MEMVTTIMVYKFTNLSRREVEAMLGITLGQTRVYQEAKAEGREEGERSLILRLLPRRVGEVPESIRVQINTLSLTQLESLAEALLDFSNLSDLETWLAEELPKQGKII
jgi:predicted transposase YdaD